MKTLATILAAILTTTTQADCTRTQETTLKQTLNIQTQEYQLETIHIAPTTKPTTPYAKHADKNGTPGPITIDTNGLLTGTPTGTDCGTTHNETYNVTNRTNDSVNVQIAVGAAVNTETDAIIYVSKWALKNIYLNNREIRAMINGDGGTRSYAPDMAQIFFDHTPGIPGTVDILEQALVNSADGDTSNDEFWKKWDPFLYDNDALGTPGVRLYSNGCDGTCGTDFNMDAEGMTLIRELITGISKTAGPVDGFLRWYVRANPQLYGGQVGGTVDINTDPTWLTQNPNNPNEF